MPTSHNVCTIQHVGGVPPGLGWPDGDFGEMTHRACRQWLRPALGDRLSSVRYCLRLRLSEELLRHIWSPDMAEVLGEIEWCVEFAQRGKGRGQPPLLPDWFSAD